MPENHLNDFEDDHKKKTEDGKKEVPEETPDIIELSDIAIGTTPEDDIIVELTEEVIDEAMVGISGATRDRFDEGEELIDLLKVEPDKESRFSDARQTGKQSVDAGETFAAGDLSMEDTEDHITKELDEFFSAEEESSAPVEILIQPSIAQIQPDTLASDQGVSQSNLVEALEIVIQKLYGDKINKLLAEAIEKTVTYEINRIKEFLIGKTKK